MFNLASLFYHIIQYLQYLRDILISSSDGDMISFPFGAIRKRMSNLSRLIVSVAVNGKVSIVLV